MRAGRPSVVIVEPAEMRAAARRGEWRGSTGGQCPAYQQANLVILPTEAAVEFAAFCTRNPKPCPLIEITPPGDPEPACSGPGRRPPHRSAGLPRLPPGQTRRAAGRNPRALAR